MGNASVINEFLGGNVSAYKYPISEISTGKFGYGAENWTYIFCHKAKPESLLLLKDINLEII